MVKRSKKQRMTRRSRGELSPYAGILGQRNINESVKQVFRFQNTNAGQSRITVVRAQVLMWHAFCSSTTVMYPVYGSVQITRVRVVGTTIADTAGTASSNSIDLIWGGGIFGRDVSINSTGNGQAFVARIDSRPPPNTSASFVTSIEGVESSLTGVAAGQGAEVLFSIVTTTGALVEIDALCSYNDTPTTYNITTTGLTQGVDWWNPMDNIALSGANHFYDPFGRRNFST